MQEEKVGASPEAQVIHHAKKLFEAREWRRAAKRSNDPAKLEEAVEAEYQRGREFDRAVRRLPP